jgi:hypothetical protein
MFTLLLLSNNKTRNYHILIVHGKLSTLNLQGSQLIYDARTLAFVQEPVTETVVKINSTTAQGSF